VYELVAARARHQCEYCHAPEAAAGYRFEVDHIVPVSAGGGDELQNLALACRSWNGTKQARTFGVDPRTG
jgi:5-methylcytosine-specific restriction endonuclease McrA